MHFIISSSLLSILYSFFRFESLYWVFEISENIFILPTISIFFCYFRSPPPPKPPPPFKRSLSLMTRKSFIKTTKSETIMMKEIRSSSEAVQRQLSATDTYQRKRSDCCTCCKICEIRSSKVCRFLRPWWDSIVYLWNFQLLLLNRGKYLISYSCFCCANMQLLITKLFHNILGLFLAFHICEAVLL